MPRAGLLVMLVVAALAPLAAQPGSPGLSEALAAALRPALPYPPARDDGTPAEGISTAPAWTIRWPGTDELRVEVVANPLHDETRRRALEAEREIQQAAFRAQQRSQGDYEQAVRDFERTGRVPGVIREVSLADDGVAGERYDAESQLTVTLEFLGAQPSIEVATGTAPVLADGIAGARAVVRVPANVFDEPGPDGEAVPHYCPEQAWVFLNSAAPDIRSIDAAHAALDLASPPSERGVVVVRLRGNAVLVDQVLRQADWPRLRSRVE